MYGLYNTKNDLYPSSNYYPPVCINHIDKSNQGLYNFLFLLLRVENPVVSVV